MRMLRQTTTFQTRLEIGEHAAAGKKGILYVRKLHPGWGPNTLFTALKTDTCWADHPLPSRAQRARLLKHAGWTDAPRSSSP